MGELAGVRAALADDLEEFLFAAAEVGVWNALELADHLIELGWRRLPGAGQ